MEIQIGTQKEKCFVDSFDPNVLLSTAAFDVHLVGLFCRKKRI